MTTLSGSSPLDVGIPFREISDRLKKGRVIPFLGAGANIGHRPFPKTDIFKDEHSGFLPTGSELSVHLAERIGFPAQYPSQNKELATVASYYEELSGRTPLVERLETVLTAKDYAFCNVHKYLASQVTTPMLIITTNYDRLLEKAFNEANHPHDVVMHTDPTGSNAASVMHLKYGESKAEYIEPARLSIDLTARTVIYKIHGSIDYSVELDENYVIAEDDYVDFLMRMGNERAIPSKFRSHFAERHFLFLGYSLRDWNMRVLLRKVQLEARSNIKSWAVQHEPSVLEKRLWARRNVMIFDKDVDEFVGELD